MSSSTPVIPFRINLEQQKKRAKDLFSAYKQGSRVALERFALQHPKLVHQEVAAESFIAKLADAQLVIARELGCKTWQALREHIALMAALRAELEGPEKSVAHEPSDCLHIRCGSDIQASLLEAGFQGEFLEFSDPLCVGPVSDSYDVQQRAKFLHRSYGAKLGRTFEQFLKRVNAQFDALQKSANISKSVVLWFEHDSYGQFILIFILSLYHRMARPEQLWLVSTDAFPGSARFIGLGQLPPEALRMLWQQRVRLDSQHCELAERHWNAFTNPDPTVFQDYCVGLPQGGLLPYFKRAALRQLQERPGNGNSLPLTQRLTLDLLAEQSPAAAGQLFSALMREKEPLPYLGDLMYWHILSEMAASGLIVLGDECELWPDTLVYLPPKS